jgi:hypothetical protein
MLTVAPKTVRNSFTSDASAAPAWGVARKQHRPRLLGYMLLSRIDRVVGFAQDLFDQQTAEAVADEEYRALAEVFLDHEVEHLCCPVGEWHAVTSVSVAIEESENAPPLRRAGGVSEGPDADVGEVGSQPVRPGC